MAARDVPRLALRSAPAEMPTLKPEELQKLSMSEAPLLKRSCLEMNCFFDVDAMFCQFLTFV